MSLIMSSMKGLHGGHGKTFHGDVRVRGLCGYWCDINHVDVRQKGPCGC